MRLVLSRVVCRRGEGIVWFVLPMFVYRCGSIKTPRLGGKEYFDCVIFL